MSYDSASVKREVEWLRRNPEFTQRPASLYEFLGPDYLNIEARVRPRIREVLTEIFGRSVSAKRMTVMSKAIITGGIGIGKTTIASIVMPYMVHWVLCLKDPQGYFDLLPGSRIAFMQMSTSESQAKEVVFGDIKARIKHSPWFEKNAQIDPSFKNQIRFDGDIWILPGDSAETTFEGYNILGGILDEMDSHKVTPTRDYAEAGYETIHGRITSRFQDRGFILLIGQMKKADGFAAKMLREYREDPKAFTEVMAIWESFGWQKFTNADGTRDFVWFDKKRKELVPTLVALSLKTDNMLEIPNVYLPDFKNNPEKALRDLAGIPPAVGDPFISLTYKIEEARVRWKQRNSGLQSPFTPQGQIEKWFKAMDSLRRCAHIDIGYSANGDAAGISMGHVREVVEIDGELKPYIVLDILMRFKAGAGQEIMIADLRRMIYELRDSLNFRIKKVTLDGFQSTDTIQQLRKKRYETELVSVDKSMLPYFDLRDAIYEDRIEFPEYLVHMYPGSTELVEIAYKELTELAHAGTKIDHPVGGSKDVADSMAGVVYTLMGDRAYRKNVRSLSDYRDARQLDQAVGAGRGLPALGNLPPLMAPVPPARIPGLDMPPTLLRPPGRES